MGLYEIIERNRGRVGLLLILVFGVYLGGLSAFVAYQRVQLAKWEDAHRVEAVESADH